MSVLRARLLELEQSKAHEAEAEARRGMVRSVTDLKIRTYNLPQDRVTDHRIGVDLHNMPQRARRRSRSAARRADRRRPGRATRGDGHRDMTHDGEKVAEANAGAAATSTLEDIFEPEHGAATLAPAVVRLLTGVHVLKHRKPVHAQRRTRRRSTGRPGTGSVRRRHTTAVDLRPALNGLRPVVLRAGPAAGYQSSIRLTNPDIVHFVDWTVRRPCCAADPWASCAIG